MAYIKKPNEQDPQGLNTSGQSTVISAGQAPVDPTASKAEGTSWVNLKQYLDANQGLGAGVANAVTGSSQKEIESAAGQLNDWQTKASTVDKSQADKLQGFKQQILTDPTKVDAKAFKDQSAAAYGNNTVATNAEGYGAAANAYGTAKDNYTNLKSDDWASRSTAVQNTYGKDNPQYSKGMGMLDTFIAQGDQAGQAAFKDYADRNASMFSDTDNSLKKATGSVQTALDAEKNRWSSLLGETQQAVKDKRTGLVTNLDGRTQQVAALNAPLNEQEDVLRAVAEKLQKQAHVAYNPDTFLSRKDYGLGDTVTDAERAELEALNNLGDYGSKVDTSKYQKGQDQGIKLSQEVLNSGDGFKYDPVTNKLVAIRSDGQMGQDVTNSQFYADILKQVFATKGYK